MKKFVRIIAKTVAALLAAIALYVLAIFGFGIATDFQPPANTPLLSDRLLPVGTLTDSTLKLLSWNIGYCGLGAASDFFFDNGYLMFSHGKMVYAPESLNRKNLEGVKTLLSRVSDCDFIMLQEVDEHSARSYDVNQPEEFSEILPDFNRTLAINFKSRNVPIPLFEPWQHYGHALSGVATYSRLQADTATRFQLPGKFPLHMRIFQLDRCVLEQRFRTPWGRELVLYNVHNSAHDKDGALKKQEMEWLRNKLLEESGKGNLVIAGGDWNQCPPGFQFDSFMPGKTQGYTQLNIEDDFLPKGWTWAFDPSTPTNRKCKSPYRRGETFVTLIDFFLVSPGVEVESVKTLDLDFEYSDHQPVQLVVKLKP
jgi:endonuclease/exonuclease/phosphatase family metal-dependent hydrolase